MMKSILINLMIKLSLTLRVMNFHLAGGSLALVLIQKTKKLLKIKIIKNNLKILR